MTWDLELTLAAIELHRWDIVLLEARLKRPPLGRPWCVTADSWLVEEHVRRGGNIGLVCGPSSDVAVVDIDEMPVGREMGAILGALAVTVVTGSGKAHCYVRWKPGLPAKIRWHGQIVGEVQRGPIRVGVANQQQVVLPPSVHPDTGRAYRWATCPLVEEMPPAIPESWRRYLLAQDRIRAAPPRPARPVSRELLSVDELHARALSQPGGKRRASGAVKFRCPECAAEGHDLHADNAAVMASGRWGCAYAPGNREHRRAIGKALGVCS